MYICTYRTYIHTYEHIASNQYLTYAGGPTLVRYHHCVDSSIAMELLLYLQMQMLGRWSQNLWTPLMPAMSASISCLVSAQLYKFLVPINVLYTRNIM